MDAENDPNRVPSREPNAGGEQTPATAPVAGSGGPPPESSSAGGEEEGGLPPVRRGRSRLLWIAAVGGIACLVGLGFLFTQHRLLKTIETVRGAASEDANRAMIEVPAGEFLMGASDPNAPADQTPQHKVALKAFLIDRVEVSNGRFKQFVEATRSTPPKNLSPQYDLWKDGTMPEEIADLPVTNADWEQATAFCKWAGGRLPTEAEWEKAARGQDGRPYPWGAADPDPIKANFGKAWAGAASLDKVDSRAEGASPYGALNMAGNVAEWVADWYDAGYYPTSPSADPNGPAAGEARSIRGGSFEGKPDMITTTVRDSLPPGDHFFKDVGFRCAKSIQD